MDADSIKSLMSILVWGGLFFFMMRFGCGAHMMGGHGHGQHGSQGDTEGEIKDPICGMTVDPQKSSFASAYRGKTFHFCSASCRDKFEREPEKFAGSAALEEQPQGGHHHG